MRCDRNPSTSATPTRSAMSRSFSVSGNSRWMRIQPIVTSCPRGASAQRLHRLAIEALHQRHQQLHGALEVAPIDDADVAVDVACGNTHRDAGHALAGDVEASGVGAAALHRLELEIDLELLGQ